MAVILNSTDFDHYLHRAFNWTALLEGERGRVGGKKRFLQREKWCGQTECYRCSLNTGDGGIINNVLSIILAVWTDRDGCPQGNQLSGHCVPSPLHWVSLGRAWCEWGKPPGIVVIREKCMSAGGWASKMPRLKKERNKQHKKMSPTVLANRPNHKLF